MDKQPDAAKLVHLRNELRKADQAPFVPDLDRVGWIYQAYTKNANELLSHIRVPHPDFQTAVETRVPGKNPQIYTEYYAELIRLLMNYSALVKALVEHSRIVERKLKVTNPVSHKEYRRRLDKILGQGITHFVQKLRDLVLHADLPTTTSEMSFSQGEPGIQFDIALDCAGLLTWSGWKHRAKAFIQEREFISLTNSIMEYDALIRPYYDWVFKEIHTVCFANATRRANLEIAIQSLERRIAKS